MKIIYKAADITEAHIVKGLLESNGLEAYVGGFYLQGGIGEIAVSDFANIQVSEKDYDKARELINEYERAESQICRESKINLPTYASRLKLTITVAIIFMILFVLIMP